MARSAEYWSARRKKQFGRFGSKALAAYSKPSVSGIAKAAWSGVKYLRTLVNSEVHKLDHQSTTTVSTSGGIIHLTDIVQGDADSTRTGNSVLVSGINIDLRMVKHASATTSFMRVIIFQDNQQVADTTPSVTDILATPNFNDFLSRTTVGRFKILSSRVYNFEANNVIRTYKKYFKISHHVRFNGTQSTDIQKGGIYLLVISDQVTNVPSLVYNTRTYFHDN